MIVIKRYPNRKLYNTEAKQYVTLDGVADLIRDGEEVQIVDHATGDDMTAVTLTQIIFEQEKKQAGFLPRPVLTGLIQSGGETLSALRRTLSMPLDLLYHVDQEIQARLDALAEAGEISPEEAAGLGDKLLSLGKPAQEQPPGEEDLERLLSRRGLATQTDLQQLNARLDDLFARLDSLNQEEH
jgi:polyhydroxyalkanoate synthesis repressor PhaR